MWPDDFPRVFKPRDTSWFEENHAVLVDWDQNLPNPPPQFYIYESVLFSQNNAKEGLKKNSYFP
jgi:hypothetical protein